MTDYVFKYTNNPSASFVVKPYTANGPASPASTSPYVDSVNGLHAIAINTPFVLIGKGVTDYGQQVQNNIVYLAENFCNTTRPIPPMKGMLWYKSGDFIDPAFPADPVVAGLYVWDGSAWNTLSINGKNTSPIDANHQRIVNVADATSSTDALTLSVADNHYLPFTGGTITGNLVIDTPYTLKVVTAPVANNDVANKIYVDSAVATARDAASAINQTVTNSLGNFSNVLASLYSRNGGVISGNVTIAGSLTVSGSGNINFGNGIGTFSVGNRIISNVGAPVLPADATTKQYVDHAISLIPPPDGVVTSASFDGTTGTLTLTRSQGLADITITDIAKKVHTHVATDVEYNVADNVSSSVLVDVTPTVSSVKDAIVALDHATQLLAIRPARTALTQTVASNTIFDFGSLYQWVVGSNRQSVFVNGIKHYANTWSKSTVVVNVASPLTLVGIPAASYDQVINVDGTDYTLAVVVSSTTTYADLLQLIKAEITTLAVPATVHLEQIDGTLRFIVQAQSSGDAYTVTIGSVVGDLFDTITAADAPVTEVGQTLSYAETGALFSASSQITFVTAPPVGSVIELTTM